MNFIIYAVLGVILLLPLVQFIIYFKALSNKTRKEENDKAYSKEIYELGKKTMHAVEAGKVKKQLLSNDAPEYDSSNALEQYVNFVEQSTVFEKVMSIKEVKFHG